MKTESTIRPENDFMIENIKGNSCEVVFFDTILEEKKEEETTIYVYNTYRITLPYRSDLADVIEANIKLWLDYAKQVDFDSKAKEVREIRDKLLQESDKNMVLDRLGFEIPESITMTNILTVIKSFFAFLANAKNGDWAIYRQQLRDITKQEGFPYNVEFPKKPE